MIGRLIGIVLFTAGVSVVLYGARYVTSPEYRLMNIVRGAMGSSDSAGYSAILAGSAIAVLGLAIVIVSGGSKRVRP